MNITVTITASSELMSLLTDFVSTVKKVQGTTVLPMQLSSTPVVALDNHAAAKSPLPDATSTATDLANAKIDEVGKTDTLITAETVRQEVYLKTQAGKRTEVKALLTKFGTDKVSNLAAGQYADFLNELKTIK